MKYLLIIIGSLLMFMGWLGGDIFPFFAGCTWITCAFIADLRRTP